MTFEEVWPEISRKVARLLAARGVPEAQRDDIIQETGIRLLRVWDRLDPDQGPWGLARSIALHAIADGTKRQTRYELAELIDIPAECDSEGRAIASFRLGSVRRALARMSPTDRRVLLAEVGVMSPPPLGRSAMKMARSRARGRLRELVERPGLWTTIAHVRIRVSAAFQRRGNELPMMASRLAEGGLAVVALAITLAVPNINRAAPHDGSPFPSDTWEISVASDRDPQSSGGDRSTGGHSGTRLPVDVGARGGPAGRDPEQADSPEDDRHWLREDVATTRRDVERMQRDAKQIGEDAEQLGQDLQQLGQDMEELAEVLRKDAERLVADVADPADDLRP